uniref:Uncharacterized protein n=1 Tax=Anguilla anguilla TaxID=7936 RepID=A0A0E9QFK2_ANGAN
MTAWYFSVFHESYEILLLMLHLNNMHSVECWAELVLWCFVSSENHLQTRFTIK